MLYAPSALLIVTGCLREQRASISGGKVRAGIFNMALPGSRQRAVLAGAQGRFCIRLCISQFPRSQKLVGNQI